MSQSAQPAWSLPGDYRATSVRSAWSERPTREWAIGGSTGADVDVCIVDSGIDGSHPLVTPLATAVSVTSGPSGPEIREDTAGDVCGHGTACAGIVRAIAPECRIHSVRVLGGGATGSGDLILAGLQHAVERRFQVVNLSLSTTKRRFVELLHELADNAYFGGSILVAAAHNLPVESYPWRFSSVISVGSHAEADSSSWYANPTPPVEFFARGVNVEVAWPGGGTMRCTGNSFAAPHVSALCALALSKHPGLTPFELKSLLYLTASNAEGER